MVDGRMQTVRVSARSLKTLKASGKMAAPKAKAVKAEAAPAEKPAEAEVKAAA